MSAVLTAYARALLPGAGFLRQLSIIEADGDECNIPNVGTADGPAQVFFFIFFIGAGKIGLRLSGNFCNFSLFS